MYDFGLLRNLKFNSCDYVTFGLGGYVLYTDLIYLLLVAH